jgi:hypothetical protein
MVAVVANRPPFGNPDVARQRPLAADDAKVIRLCGGKRQNRREEKKDERQPAHESQYPHFHYILQKILRGQKFLKRAHSCAATGFPLA